MWVLVANLVALHFFQAPGRLGQSWRKSAKGKVGNALPKTMWDMQCARPTANLSYISCWDLRLKSPLTKNRLKMLFCTFPSQLWNTWLSGSAQKKPRNSQRSKMIAIFKKWASQTWAPTIFNHFFNVTMGFPWVFHGFSHVFPFLVAKKTVKTAHHRRKERVSSGGAWSGAK